MDDDKLTISAMAKLCGTSVKTLRVYGDAGLLIPSEVNPENHYRYYTADQCAMFDMIKGMQALGYSLDEIRDLVSEPNVDKLEASLTAHVSELREHIARLETTLGVGESMLNACQDFRTYFTDDSIHVARLPERLIIRVGIHYEPLKDPTLDGEGQIKAWDANVREMRRWAKAQGYPLATFHNAGGIITRGHLKRRLIYDDDSFVFAPADCDLAAGKTDGIPPEMFDVMPGSVYVFRYMSSIADPDGGNGFTRGVSELLDYIDEHGWEIAGDYFGAVIAESELFGYTSRDMLYRLSIPVIGPKTDEKANLDTAETTPGVHGGLLGFLRQFARQSGK